MSAKRAFLVALYFQQDNLSFGRFIKGTRNSDEYDRSPNDSISADRKKDDWTTHQGDGRFAIMKEFEGINLNTEEGAYEAEENFNNRMLASVDITIRNNCMETANVFAVCKNSANGYSGSWHKVAANSETSSPICVTYGTEFFLYAKSGGIEWSGNSDFCLEDGQTCLKSIQMDSNMHRFTYTLICINGGSGDSSTSQKVTTTAVEGDGKMSLRIGGGSSVTDRDKMWLDEHNSRRRARHGNDYVALRWSNEIKNSAQAYANKLIARDGCVISHGYQGDSYGGENLACNWGGGGLRHPSDVLTRWVEKEENLSFNQKFHYLQVIWKSTEFLGCGEASKPHNGGECYIQVCRYLRPGNCNANSGNWQQKMLEKNSPCTPFEPSDA